MSWENAYQPYQPRQESSGKALASLILGWVGVGLCVAGIGLFVLFLLAASSGSSY